MTRRMSKQAGFSIAMGDPAPAVPRAVDVVTDINRGPVSPMRSSVSF